MFVMMQVGALQQAMFVIMQVGALVDLMQLPDALVTMFGKEHVAMGADRLCVFTLLSNTDKDRRIPARALLHYRPKCTQI